jgi:hypothetical protein
MAHVVDRDMPDNDKMSVAKDDKNAPSKIESPPIDFEKQSIAVPERSVKSPSTSPEVPSTGFDGGNVTNANFENGAEAVLASAGGNDERAGFADSSVEVHDSAIKGTESGE